MKIEKYFDLDFLNLVANDAKALQELCNEDNGFIFKRLQDCNIFPDKKVIQKIESHMAIVFLFENYPITDDDYIKYSSFFKDDSEIIKKFNESKKHSIERNSLVEVLFDKNKSFNSPDLVLDKNDFIKYKDFYNKNLSESKLTYLLGSFSCLSPEDIKQIPLCIFKENMDLYKISSYYLFDDSRHLQNYRNYLKNESKYIPFSEIISYLEKDNDISLLENISPNRYSEERIRKIYSLFKKGDINFTINDIFPYVCTDEKIKIINEDYTGDFDSKILLDTYLNNENKLMKDFGWDYLKLRTSNLPPVLQHYISLVDSVNSFNQYYNENKEFYIIQLINLLEDKEKTRFINLSKINGNHDFVLNLSKLAEENLKTHSRENLDKFINLYYSQIFEDNKNLINNIPSSMLNRVYEKTSNSLNKFITLCSLPFLTDSDNKKIKEWIKDLPTEYHNDLSLLLDNKQIKLNSPLFEADCALKIFNRNGISYLNKTHLEILSKDTIISFLNKGSLVEDENWKLSLHNFYPQYRFKDWELQYLKIKSNSNDNGPILKELIIKIQKDHSDSYFIFGKEINYKKILPELFAVCSEKLEFINNSREVYFEFNKIVNDSTYECDKETAKIVKKIHNKVKRANIQFKKLNEFEQAEIKSLMKPKNFFEVSVFVEVTGEKEFLTNYVISQLRKEESQRELYFCFDMIHKDCLRDIMQIDSWKKENISTKENMFIYAVQNFDNKMFYNTLKLIDFNNPKDELENKLKNYTISNYSDKLLFSNRDLQEVWKYNLEDLYHMFQGLNNNWTFKRDDSRMGCYIKTAIQNSSKDMLWQILEEAKKESPAIYTMLLNPQAISDMILLGDNLFSEEFKIFKKNYLEKNPEQQFIEGSSGKIVESSLNYNLYLSEIIDLDVVVQGINSIRKDLAKHLLNDNKDQNNILTDNYLNNILIDSLNYICSLSDEKIKSVTNNLMELDISNINLIVDIPFWISLYGKDNMKELIIKKIESVEDINKVFLKELSSVNYKEDNNIKKFKCHTIEDRNNPIQTEFDQELLEIFARNKPENALMISHLYSQEEIFKNNFNSSKKISLIGNFENLRYMCASSFSDNIHSFAENFYRSSETFKKITDNVSCFSEENNTDSSVFKL